MRWKEITVLSGSHRPWQGPDPYPANDWDRYLSSSWTKIIDTPDLRVVIYNEIEFPTEKFGVELRISVPE